MATMKLMLAGVCFAALISLAQQAKPNGKKRNESSYDDCPLDLNKWAVKKLRKYFWFPNPVGGNASLVYTSPEQTTDLPDTYPPGSSRARASVVYAYTRECTKSYFHKLKGMETVSYVRGAPLKIHVLNPAARNMTTYLIGPRQKDGFTAVIPREHYLVSTLRHNPGPGDKFAFSVMSITLVPANTYPDDVDQPSREKLLDLFPDDPKIKRLIKKFTPEPKDD